MQFALKTTTVTILTTLQINISLITWAGNGSTADALVVVDNTGKDIWRAFAQSPQYDLSLSFGSSPVSVNGINVTTIGSGTLTIYYR